ncbi:nucleotidyltransferase domain-containing protein [Candidatus Woesearchaeota archaeon]|nr:nucleotidyltransferase domain-containing protein [Candidatus Woesearchaeota archaeon]
MLENINIMDFRILSVFVPDFARIYSIREIISTLGINYSYGFKRIKELVKKNILLEDKGRHSSRISFNLNNLNNIKLISFVEEQTSENVDFVKLKLIIQEVCSIDPFACIGLFGSRASSRAKKDSDWDVFIISCKKKEVEKLCNFKTSIYENVHFQVFSLEEFKDSLESPEETVIRHIIRNKKILYNPHPFYGIIRNWQRLTYAPTQRN